MRFFAMMPVLLLGCGCSAITSPIVDSFRWLSLSEEYGKANRAFERGEIALQSADGIANGYHDHFAIAVASYEMLEDRMPESGRREVIFFRMARAHEELGNFIDAEFSYNEYLERYSSGRFAGEASRNLSRIAMVKAERASIGEARIASAQEELEALLGEEELAPDDPEVKYRLGNLFYEIGRYDRAGRYYYEAQQIEATYQDRELVRRRLFINSRGEPEALSPGALIQIDRDRNPLVVFDVHRFRETRNTRAFIARQVYTTLTGKVRNQGSMTVTRASIEVVFYNAVNEVLDIRNIEIGTLEPGEVRAFWGRGSSYDSILNVDQVRFFPRGDW